MSEKTELSTGREKRKRKSQVREVWKRMKKNKLAMAGLFVLTVFVLMAVFADFIADYDTKVVAQSRNRLAAPSAEHWFGTDYIGRDVFARIVHGGRISLTIGLGTTIIAVGIGGLIGAACGYYGGLFDYLVMRVSDMLMCIPYILLTLAIIAALGTSMTNLVIATTFSSIPAFIRVMRSYILTIIGNEYIEAAKASGMGGFGIITTHILPNVIGPIAVEATMNVAGMILSIAGLSFLGMGVQPPVPEWGAMLSESRNHMVNHSYLVIFPGLFIILSSLALNLMGDGLRDAIDPRLKD